MAMLRMKEEGLLDCKLKPFSHILAASLFTALSQTPAITDLATTERLAALAPPGALLVTESGITGPADVRRLEASGARAMLVGESLMRQADVTQAVRDLMS